MNRHLQQKVKTGKYQSPQEVIDFALQLLDEYKQITDAEWREDIRQKIDEAILVSKNHPLYRWRNFCH
jgi:Arc/MetJ-type ribon-helix-helix transcriptional regulator